MSHSPNLRELKHKEMVEHIKENHKVTIKSYTDLEQSKKLAEILPLESADMKFNYDYNEHRNEEIPMVVTFKNWDDPYNKAIPCWSLAALLGVLKERDDCTVLEMFTNKAQLYRITTSYYKGSSWENTSIMSDNPIDACYEMIIKLHELNLL